MNSFIRSFLVIIALCGTAFAQTAAILPNAVSQYFDNNGNPLSAGTVTTYIVGTSTLKTTWRDAAETIPNTNPVILDAGGKAIIYGDGNYRQVLRDRFGNLIWDAVTSAFGSGGATLFGDGTSVGTILPWSGIVAPTHYVFAYGQELSRVTYSSLYGAITLNTPLNCTSASNILSGISDTTQIPIGAPVEVSCLAAGTTVTAKSTSTVTVSNNASVSIGTQARFFPWGNGNGTTTFNVPDLRGRVLPGRDNMGGTVSARLTSTYYGANPDAMGASGGAQSATLGTTNLPAYTPVGTIVSSVTDPGHGHFVANTDSIPATPLSSSNRLAAVRNSGDFNNYILSGSATTPNSGVSSSQITGVTVGSVFTGTAQGGTDTPFSIVPPSITLNYIIKITPDTTISTLNVVTSLGGMTGDITCGVGLTCSSQSVSVQAGVGTGDVLGPSSSILGQSAVFADTSGKILAASNVGVSITSYGAKCDNGTDDGPAVQTALSVNKIITVPAASNYCIINTSVTIPAGATIYAEATGINFNGSANCFKTSASIDMFTINGDTSLLGVCFQHDGASGRIIADTGSKLGSNIFNNVSFYATNNSNTDPLVYFNSSSNRVRGCIMNQQRPSAYGFFFDATGSAIQIANEVDFCLFGGVHPAAGHAMFVGSSDGTARQEGFVLNYNQYVAQGPSNLWLDATLGFNAIGNVFDQAWGNNIVISPSAVGVSDVNVIGGYISTPNQQTTGVCASQLTTTHAATNITFANVSFRFCGFGVAFGANASNWKVLGNTFDVIGSTGIVVNGSSNVVIDSNTTANVGANFSYSIADGASGGPITVTNNQWDPTGNIILNVTTPSKYRWANNTGAGGAFPAALTSHTAASSGALAISNNLSDLNSASTSRTNLGLGPIATLGVGTGLAISGSNLIATGSGSGTVTSVSLTMPSLFSVGGSPVTTTGTLAVTANVIQGDMVYATGAGVLAVLAKNASATRYLSNTGTSNNPAWAQVDLTSGITGNLPVGNLNSGTSASNTTFWRGDGTWSVPVAAGTPCTTTSLSVQYDNAGVFGCVNGVTSDGTLMRFTAGDLALRDTSASFDILLTATSSTPLTGNRALTVDMGNVAHTVALGSIANTITFPSVASDTVVMAAATQTLTNKTLTAAVLNGTVTGTSQATANTVSTLVMRDASGNFSAGTISAALTGNASTATALATPRAIYGNNFDGTAALAQIIASTFGGTGNGFAKLSGPTTSEKTFTLPNASATILTDNAAVTVTQGGTGITSGTSGGVPTFTATGTITSSGALTANLPVIGGGAGAVVNVGTRSGNTTAFVTTTGTQTSGNCVSIDASGNHIASGSSCGAASAITIGSTTVSSGTNTAILYNNSGTLGNYTISGSGTVVPMAAGASLTAIAGLGIRDTSAAFDLTIAATSSAALSAGRTLTLDTGNVAHTLALGTTANTITFPNNASFTVAGISVSQTWSAVQSFNSGNLVLNGASSGSTTLNASSAASGTLTLPAATDTLVGKATTDTLTNKTLTTAVLNGTITGTSQATANTVSTLVMRDASGNFAANTVTLAGRIESSTSSTVLGLYAATGFGIGIGDIGSGDVINFSRAVNDVYTSSASTLGANGAFGGLFVSLTNTATTSAVCFNTSTKAFSYDGTLGTCTVSLLAAKDLVSPLTPEDGFRIVMAMEPWRYTMKKDLPTWVDGEQIGFIADYAERIDSRVVARNHDGSLSGFRYEQYTAALTAAFKYLKSDNDNLRHANDNLERRLQVLETRMK